MRRGCGEGGALDNLGGAVEVMIKGRWSRVGRGVVNENYEHTRTVIVGSRAAKQLGPT